MEFGLTFGHENKLKLNFGDTIPNGFHENDRM